MLGCHRLHQIPVIKHIHHLHPSGVARCFSFVLRGTHPEESTCHRGSDKVETGSQSLDPPDSCVFDWKKKVWRSQRLSEPVNIYETLWQTQVPCSSFNKFRRAHWTLSFKPHKFKKSQVKDVFIRGDVSLPFSRLSSLKGLLRSHRLIKMHERWSQYLYFTACMCANKKADIFSRVGQTELPVICALAWWRGAQSVRRVFIEGSFMSVNPFRRRLRLHPLSLDRIIQ